MPIHRQSTCDSAFLDKRCPGEETEDDSVPDWAEGIAISLKERRIFEIDSYLAISRSTASEVAPVPSNPPTTTTTGAFWIPPQQRMPRSALLLRKPDVAALGGQQWRRSQKGNQQNNRDNAPENYLRILWGCHYNARP